MAEAWEEAGLGVTEAKPVEGSRYGAGYCSTGKVSGLEVLVCEFRADSELEAARKQLQAEWQQHGLHTAVTVQAKRTLVAVMDRSKADREGRTISKLVAAVGKL